MFNPTFFLLHQSRNVARPADVPADESPSYSAIALVDWCRKENQSLRFDQEHVALGADSELVAQHAHYRQANSCAADRYR